MNKNPHIDPFFFSNPMNGLLGILLILVLLPFISLLTSLIITYSLSILGLLFILMSKNLKAHWESLCLGASTLILFTVVSISLELIYGLGALAYQILLLCCYIPLSVVSLIRLRKDGYGLHSMTDFCQEELHRQLLIEEHKRINKHLLIISVFLLLCTLPITLRTMITGVSLICKMGEHILSIFLFIPFVCLYIYEIICLYFIRNRLSIESWIPIYDKTGQIVGRRCLSEIERSSNKIEGYIPVVRVCLRYQDMIYLQDNKSVGYNTPYIDWLKDSQDPRQIVKQMLLPFLSDVDNKTITLALKYTKVMDSSRSLIVFLYSVRLSDCHELLTKEGKWWQIDALSDSSIYAHLGVFIKEELTYLRETNQVYNEIKRRQNEC